VGSSTSKPRKGHEKSERLPKVGTPANEEWEHETHQSVMFGSTGKMAAVGVIGVIVVVGLLLLTL
jgi:hypothetical protein